MTSSWEEEMGDIMGEEMMGDIIMGGGDNGMMVLRRWVRGNSETGRGIRRRGGTPYPFSIVTRRKEVRTWFIGR